MIAHYIERLDLWLLDGVDDDPQQHKPASPALEWVLERLQSPDSLSLAVKRLLEDSTYLQAAKQDPELWWRRIQIYEEDDRETEVNLATVFLLSLLPNVRELTLPTDWRNLDAPDESQHGMVAGLSPEAWPVLDTIAREAGSGIKQGAALGKLERGSEYCRTLLAVAMFTTLYAKWDHSWPFRHFKNLT